MSNLFNFFKKKPTDQSEPEVLSSEPIVEKQIQLNDIVIHTMPERFRHQPIKADSAKTTGLLIVGGGIIFLILVSLGLYYFLFKKPTATVKLEPSTAEVTPPSDLNQNQPEIKPSTPTLGNSIATTTEPVISQSNNSLATSTATTTSETIESGLTVGFTPGLDSDSDGLTDTEESLLKTDALISDTDGDGYADGAELLNLYDPAGQGILTTNLNVAFYENKTFNYSALYPGAWQTTVNGGDDSIMFKSADNQFFQIIVQVNTVGQALDQWYMDQLDAATVNDADRVFGPDWQGIKSLDGLTLYLMDAKQKYIFTLAYNPGENNILEYANIFAMMIKSFSLKE